MSLIQKKELMEHELKKKKKTCIVSDDHCIDKKNSKESIYAYFLTLKILIKYLKCPKSNNRVE